jgi:signal peptidase I
LELRWKEEPTPTRRGLGCLLQSVLVVAILVIICTFVAQPFRVEENSMVPTIDPGDWVLIDKLTPGISDYARGDIVLERASGSIFGVTSLARLTRIIGQPGDTVDFDNGMVYVTPPDGVRRREGAAPPDPGFPRTTERWVLQADEYFLIGDNRAVNPYFGFGPRNRQGIEGRVWQW